MKFVARTSDGVGVPVWPFPPRILPGCGKRVRLPATSGEHVERLSHRAIETVGRAVPAILAAWAGWWVAR